MEIDDFLKEHPSFKNRPAPQHPRGAWECAICRKQFAKPARGSVILRGFFLLLALSSFAGIFVSFAFQDFGGAFLGLIFTLIFAAIFDRTNRRRCPICGAKNIFKNK
ncbi:MAG: hypothetical protein IKS15_05690 [Opitutales bacterium]|nr:hypothetical protein [Opitutales bacterium]